jgi:mono/diheme cytochrome c family protein
MTNRLLGAVVAFALVAAGPALADEPGPGGTRPVVPKTGEEVYRMVCQACHMAGAVGAVGAGTFPALASNPRLAAPGYGIYIVENGRGGMPGFKGVLTPAQTADVLTYLRSHFGNSYSPPVTAADIEAGRRPR